MSFFCKYKSVEKDDRKYFYGLTVKVKMKSQNWHIWLIWVKILYKGKRVNLCGERDEWGHWSCLFVPMLTRVLRSIIWLTGNTRSLRKLQLWLVLFESLWHFLVRTKNIFLRKRCRFRKLIFTLTCMDH